MVFLKTISRIIINLSTIITIYVVLLSISMVFVAIADKKSSSIYPCSIQINTDFVDEWLFQKEFIKSEYHYTCSTLYVEIQVDDNLNKKEVIALGIELSLTKPIDNHVEILMYTNNNSYFITLEENGAITIISHIKNN